RVTSLVAAITGAVLPIGMLASGPLAEILGIKELFLIAIVAGLFFITVLCTSTNILSLDHSEEMDLNHEALSSEKVIKVSG
ncbi:MAG: hypothetical protein ACFFAU_09540, partial [Candidatus Hodarchaeota archaeon]